MLKSEKSVLYALAMPIWRPILGGLIGFVGICLEFCGLITIYPLVREKMPRGDRFYKFLMYVYLAIAGGAVHLPCGAFMWIYKSVAEAAGQALRHDIALKYLLYFLLPVTGVFTVFFIAASAVRIPTRRISIMPRRHTSSMRKKPAPVSPMRFRTPMRGMARCAFAQGTGNDALLCLCTCVSREQAGLWQTDRTAETDE